MYRMYVAEGIKAVAENTTRPYGGMALQFSLQDLLSGKIKEETRSGKEIIDHISNKLDVLGREISDGRI